METPHPTLRFEKLPLQTERLRLRPCLAADAQALFEIHSDPVVMRYWNSPAWTSIEQAHEAIEHDAKALQNGDCLNLGIETLEDARLLGRCMLFKISRPHRRAELGYCLDASAWGKGYMSEALRELIDYGFTHLRLNRIEAELDPRNAASKKILERLGFRHEGLLRKRWIVNGKISDGAIYGLLRPRWRDTRTERPT
jgi:[ribosomal protein S5]-alanine N-acetyltransferase